MSTHSPKTSALMAYESGALSQPGRARLERHLKVCALCQRELAAIQTYEATVDHIRDARAPELDWSRMELALEREAHAQAKRHRRGWALPAMGVVFAAAAAVLLLVRGPATDVPTIATHVGHVVDGAPPATLSQEPATLSQEHRAAGSQEHRAAGSPYEGAVLTLVSGASDVRSGDAIAIAQEGHHLAMGDTLATSATGSVHARLASGLGIALEPGTQVRLAMLDGAGADAAVPQIAMDRGRMSVRVYEARTVILAGAYRIEVEVASFAVDLDAEDGALTLDVREGAAHVVGPSTDQTLTGPAHFPEASAALEASEPVGTSDGYGAQPLLHVARPGIVRWEIADVNVRGAGDLAMRVGVGPTTISGWDAHGRMFRAEVDVTAGGLDLTPDELMPEGPRVHAGYLEVREITPVVREHQAAITRCYEHAMRASPPFSAHVRAVVSIELTGAVESVRFSGDPIPASMQTCMTNQIGTWIFPPPHGGAFTLPIPFNFGT